MAGTIKINQIVRRNKCGLIGIGLYRKVMQITLGIWKNILLFNRYTFTVSNPSS